MEYQSEVLHKESEISGNIYELSSKSGLLTGFQYEINKILVDRNPVAARRRVRLGEGFASDFYNNNHVRQSSEITLRECIKASLLSMKDMGLYPHALFSDYLSNIAENYSPHGFTAAREIMSNLMKVASEYGKQQNKKLSLDLLYLWSPVFLPGTNRYESDLQEREDFCRIFDIEGEGLHEYFKRGRVGKCDFLACFKSDDFVYLSVIEFSHKYDTYFYQLEGDIELFEIHRRKKGAYNSVKGGIFNYINEDMVTSSFKMADIHKDTNLATYYTDKSFMKLCQAASYAYSAIQLLRTKYANLKIYVDIQSMLNLEPVQLVRGFIDSPIEKMIRSMSELYRHNKTATESIEEYHSFVTRELETHMQIISDDVKDKVRRELAYSFQNKSYEYDIAYEEFIKDLNTTNNRQTIDEFSQKIADEHLVNRTRQHMQEMADDTGTVTYREAHASAVVASLELAPRGELSLLGLVGNAGIGKTTAFSNYLKKSSRGWFGLYSSCRVTINRDVLQSISKTSLEQNLGICCLTTNSRFIKAAPKYAENYLENYQSLIEQKHFINSAVVVGGVGSLNVFSAGQDYIFDAADQHAVIFPKKAYFYAPNSRQTGYLLANTHDGNAEAGLESCTDRSHYQTVTISKDQEQIVSTAPAGVFKSLLGCYATILEQNQDINKTLMCLATQAFKFNGKGESPLLALNNIIFGAASDDMDISEKITRLQDFAARQPDIYVMLDEITGDEDGISLAITTIQALQQVFINPFLAAGVDCPFKVVVILADASLTSPESLQNYLCSGDVSARVNVYDADEKGVDFKVSKGLLPVYINMVAKKMPITYIETNTFPAPNLKIRNRMVLGRDIRGDLDISIERFLKNNDVNTVLEGGKVGNMSNDPSKSRKSKLFPRTVSIAVEEIERAIAKGGFSENHQVIYFSQNRQELEYVRKSLINDKIVDFSAITTITSSTSSDEKKRAIDPDAQGDIKVILMTSAASRGLSFPRATTIIGNVPDFNIESQLMELMQLVYRGRGGYVDNLGNVSYGDSLDKQLVFIVNDEFLVEDNLLEEDLAINSTSLWFKKTRDMMMILALIKACLLSRIMGNAGIQYPCLIIPLGEASNKTLRDNGFAEKLNELNKELSNVVLSGSEDGKRMAISIQNRLMEVFSSADYTFAPSQEQNGLILYDRPEFIEIKKQVAWSLDKCILGKNGEYNRNLEFIDFIGDLAIQKIEHKKYEEAVQYSLDEQAGKEAYYALKKLLKELLDNNEPYLSSGLRSAANDVKELMEREHFFGSSYDLTRQVKRSNTSYIIWPINIHKFWYMGKKVVFDNIFREDIDEDMLNMAWHTGLKQPIGMDVARPLLPDYKTSPFILAGDKPNAYGDNRKSRTNSTDVLVTTGTNMINLLFLKS